MSPQEENSDQMDGKSIVDIHVEAIGDNDDDIKVNVTSEIETEATRSTPNIVKAYFGEVPDETRNLQAEMKCAEKLRSLGDYMNERIEAAFSPLRGMNTNSRYEQFIRIAKRVFANGINWGRVAILFALAMKYIHLCGRENVEEMIKFLIGFITKKLLHWVVASGGWIALTDEVLPRIKQSCPENWVIMALGTCCVAMAAYIVITKPKQG